MIKRSLNGYNNYFTYKHYIKFIKNEYYKIDIEYIDFKYTYKFVTSCRTSFLFTKGEERFEYDFSYHKDNCINDFSGFPELADFSIIPSNGDIILSEEELYIYYKNSTNQTNGILIGKLSDLKKLRWVALDFDSFYYKGEIFFYGPIFMPKVIKLGQISDGFYNDNFIISINSSIPYDIIPQIYMRKFNITDFCRLVDNNFKIFCKFSSDYIDKFSGRYYNLSEDSEGQVLEVKLIFIKKNSQNYDIGEDEYTDGND